MPTKTVDVDFDLDEFSDEEIIDYLIEGLEKKRIKEEDFHRLNTVLSMNRLTAISSPSLLDIQRLEIFYEYAGRYTPMELEARLK